MSKPSATIAHLPALDGLRGLAVLGVVLFHASGLLPGGYLGVDLFFVLSGYLITSILLAEHAARARIDLRRFWIRRARRLFPALLSVLFAMGLYARFVAKPDELAGLRGDTIATLFYVANWRAVFSNKDYWELFVAPSPLEHTWSLAIEEQFYLLWPLLVTGLLVLWRRSSRVLLAVTVALALGSMLAMWLLFDGEHTARTYLGTDTRAGGILLGAALAICLRPGTTLSLRTVRLFDVMGLFAALGLALAWCTLEGENPFLYRGGFWLTELACLSLIACGVAGTRSLWARLLAIRPLVYLGTISYGVYLWHWPLNCVLTPERLGGNWALVHGLRAILTLGLSAISYRFYEKPIRSRGIFFGSPAVVVPSAIAACLGVVFACTRPRDEPSRTPAAPQPTVAPAGSAAPELGIFTVPFNTLPRRDQLQPSVPRILVLGDSVASKLGYALRYRQDEFGVFVAERGVGNCSIFDSAETAGIIAKGKNAGTTCSSAWAADVRELRPEVTLLVLGGGFFTRTKVGKRLVKACEPGFAEAYTRRLQQLTDPMKPEAGQFVVTLVPYPVGRWRSRGLLERVDCFNKTLKAFADSRGLPTIDLMKHVCPTADCNLMSDGEPIRPDGLHFDGVGAEDSARFTLRELLRVTGRVPHPATPAATPAAIPAAIPATTPATTPTAIPAATPTAPEARHTATTP